MKRCTVYLLLLILAACHPAPATGNRDRAHSEGTAAIELQGTVVFINLEGGFFGIVDVDGHHYDPVNLPANFAVDGKKVRVRGRTLPGTLGFHMWGTRIDILSIEEH